MLSNPSFARKVRKAKKKDAQKLNIFHLLEGSIGIEPMHSGFADQSLTTWARPHNVPKLYQISGSMSSGIPLNHEIFCIKTNKKNTGSRNG